MFILRATNPKDAADEKELRQWLVNEVGAEDQKILSDWLWESHRGNAAHYVDGLAALVRETGTNDRSLLDTVLELAKKPQEQRQQEQDILKWVQPKLEKAIAYVRKAGKEAAGRAFEDICWELEEKLRGMFPNVHRATMKGAMISAFVHENGAFKFDVAKLVKTLRSEDPLSVNAAASWG